MAAYKITLGNRFYYQEWAVTAANIDAARAKAERIAVRRDVRAAAREEYLVALGAPTEASVSREESDYTYKVSRVQVAQYDATRTPRMVDSGGNG